MSDRPGFAQQTGGFYTLRTSRGILVQKGSWRSGRCDQEQVRPSQYDARIDCTQASQFLPENIKLDHALRLLNLFKVGKCKSS